MCRPDAVENEKQLNEDAAKWQNAAHQDSRHCMDTQWLLRDLSRLWTCSHRMLNCLNRPAQS